MPCSHPFGYRHVEYLTYSTARSKYVIFLASPCAAQSVGPWRSIAGACTDWRDGGPPPSRHRPECSSTSTTFRREGSRYSLHLSICAAWGGAGAQVVVADDVRDRHHAPAIAPVGRRLPLAGVRVARNARNRPGPPVPEAARPRRQASECPYQSWAQRTARRGSVRAVSAIRPRPTAAARPRTPVRAEAARRTAVMAVASRARMISWRRPA
jgi:hypothetical protein